MRDEVKQGDQSDFSTSKGQRVSFDDVDVSGDETINHVNSMQSCGRPFPLLSCPSL